MMPLPVVLVLLVVGLILLVAGRRRRLGIGFIAAGTVLLLMVSFPWLSERALMDLEQDYPVLREPPQAEWIVVLGGGSRDNQSLPPASRLGESSMYRLAEGVRIAKLLPDARLVTSGGGSDSGDLSTAEIMEQVAVGWGIDASRIITLTDP
ncbi:MAG: ElyC/SanA/YdcF family protein, partial [Thermodesulfobacteriota bacterium]